MSDPELVRLVQSLPRGSGERDVVSEVSEAR